jgi:hypothetical protein
MRNLLILILTHILAGVAGFGWHVLSVAREDIIPVASLKVDNGLHTLGGSAFTGMALEKEADGGRTYTLYAAGKAHGYAYSLWPSGGLRDVRQLKSGILDGEQLGFYVDGKIAYHQRYKDGQYEGEQREWHPNGYPYKRRFFKDGQEDGTQQVWRPNGRLVVNYELRDGEPYGLLGTEACIDDMGM